MSTYPTHSSADRLLTAEEFFALPGDGPPAELVRGQVVMMNMPRPIHGWLCGEIAFQLKLYLAGHDLGSVFTNDTGVITRRSPDSVRGADVAYYSYERLTKGPLPKDYPANSPELIFEVLSPDDRWKNVTAKVEEYLAAGVHCVVVVDPDREALVVHRSDRPTTMLHKGQSLTLPELLPGFELALDILFSRS